MTKIRNRLEEMLDHAPDSICGDIEYMGPVRAVDFEDAFVRMIDCINDISGKASDE